MLGSSDVFAARGGDVSEVYIAHQIWQDTESCI